jgi:glycosyltransferase involved in cell wall biosynthesis
MPYLPEAVESILRQSFIDFTFIIVNDGSTDGTREYLDALRDPRIVLINQANAGQGSARNTALRSCRSEYVALMDADDISHPERFRFQLDYLDSHPDVVMLGTQFECLVGDVAQRALTLPADHHGIETRLLKGQAGLCNTSLMFRNTAASSCGGYPDGFVGEDIDFCLRMCEQGHVANLARVLIQYRMHPTQTSLTKYRQLISATHYAAHRAICRRKGLPEPELNRFIRNASLFTRWRWAAEAQAVIQYRMGRIRIAGGKPVEGILRLALSGICRPFTTIRRVAGTIETLLRGQAN